MALCNIRIPSKCSSILYYFHAARFSSCSLGVKFQQVQELRSQAEPMRGAEATPLRLNVCWPRGAGAPRAGNRGKVEGGGVEVGGGGDAYDSPPRGFSLSVWHPRGEHPINPSMLVQRQIGSFECQWTRRLFWKVTPSHAWISPPHTHTHTHTHKH